MQECNVEMTTSSIEEQLIIFNHSSGSNEGLSNSYLFLFTFTSYFTAGAFIITAFGCIPFSRFYIQNLMCCILALIVTGVSTENIFCIFQQDNESQIVPSYIWHVIHLTQYAFYCYLRGHCFFSRSMGTGPRSNR